MIRSRRLPPLNNKDDTTGNIDDPPNWFGWVFAGYLVTILLSVILKLSVGGMDLGSPVGALLLFIFWSGIGAFLYSFKADKDEQKLLRYGGILGVLLPVALIILIAVGGIVADIAMAIAFVLYLFLWYLHRTR